MQILFFKHLDHTNRFIQFAESCGAKFLLCFLQLLAQFSIFMAQFTHDFVSNPVDTRKLCAQRLELSASIEVKENTRNSCRFGYRFSRKISLRFGFLVHVCHEDQELSSPLLSFHSLWHG